MRLVLSLLVWAVACQPRPLDVIEERQEFPRDGLRQDRILVAELPKDAERFSVIFEDTIELLGSRILPKNPEPGDELRITSYYRVLKPLPESWKFFVHLDAIGLSNRMHGDHCPCDGRYPTSYWQPKEIVADTAYIGTHGHPRADYNIWTGFYIDKRRMRITKADGSRRDKDNRAKLARMKLGQ